MVDLRVGDRDERQLDRCVRAIRESLGPRAVAVVLHGSAVEGGLRPSSDLDVLVVVDQPTTQAQRARLVSSLLEVSGSRASVPGRPVEATVVAATALHPWEHPVTIECQYGEWRRASYDAGEVPGPTVSSDATIQLDSAARRGRSLWGPSPETLLPAIPAADVVAASLSGVDGLLANIEGDERNVLLTFARMLVTVEGGVVVPKDVAADAVAPRFGGATAGVLRDAAEDHRGERVVAWETRTGGVRRAIGHLREVIEQAAAARLDEPTTS